jgi:Predicted ATPase/kinase involved in NAD metabolism
MIVVVSGPESVGKTSLCQQLAECYQGEWIPEFARTYLETLPFHYRYEDVEHIAEVQYRTFQNYSNENRSTYIFFDTYLIITKIWFLEVFGQMPQWLDMAIRKSRIDLVLLLVPDLPWENDPLRENGSMEKRLYLFEKYQKELDFYSIPYYIVDGIDEVRLERSRIGISKMLSKNTTIYDKREIV